MLKIVVGSAMPKSHDRAEGQTAVTISLPAALLKRIDALAVRDKRSRSNWIVVHLEKLIASDDHPKPAAPASPKAPSGAPAKDALTDRPPTGSAPGLNEEPRAVPRVGRTRAVMRAEAFSNPPRK